MELSESMQDQAGNEALKGPRNATPGISHLRILVWLDQTGLPAWQISLTSFLFLTTLGVTALIIDRVPNPEMYSNVVAFVAIISFFIILYLDMGRGWHKDLQSILTFDQTLSVHLSVLTPSSKLVTFELLIAAIWAFININWRGNFSAEFSLVLRFTVFSFYFLEYMFVILFIDMFVRQLIILMKIADNIRLDLLQTDFYSTLANVMFRFLKLYIFGLCIVTLSYNVFTEGALSPLSLAIIIMPFYLPGLVILGLYLVPYNHFKNRMHRAKETELNHVVRAINGDKEHLSSTLIGDDAARLTKVDLLYYEDRIRKIKEWPFTDRIRSLLLFGVLPPMTWVVAALIEISIESIL